MRHTTSPTTDQQLQAAAGALDELAHRVHAAARATGADRSGAALPLDAAGVLAASAAAQATLQATAGASHPDTTRGTGAAAKLSLAALDPMRDDYRDPVERHARAAARLTLRAAGAIVDRRLFEVPDLIDAARREVVYTETVAATTVGRPPAPTALDTGDQDEAVGA